MLYLTHIESGFADTERVIDNWGVSGHLYIRVCTVCGDYWERNEDLKYMPVISSKNNTIGLTVSIDRSTGSLVSLYCFAYAPHSIREFSEPMDAESIEGVPCFRVSSLEWRKTDNVSVENHPLTISWMDDNLVILFCESMELVNLRVSVDDQLSLLFTSDRALVGATLHNIEAGERYVIDSLQTPRRHLFPQRTKTV